MDEQTQSPLVAGLGVDIVEVERMEAILARSPRFVQRVYTQGERDYCESKHLKAAHYATHFAAKEAVLKALGCGFANGIGFTDVEVAHDDKGRPVPLLHGKAAEIAQQQGIIEFHLSLSRTHGTAVANAIAVNEASRVKPPEEKVSAKEELAAAFKELRGMLDELDAPAEEDDQPDEDEQITSEVATKAELADDSADNITQDHE